MSFLNQNKFYNSILNEIDNGKDTNYSFEVYGYCRAGDEARFRDFVSKFPEIKMSPLNESGNVSLSEYRLKASPRSMLALYNLLIISDSEFWIYEERQPPQAEITTVNVDIAASGVAFSARDIDNGQLVPVNCQQNAFSVIPAGTEALFTRDVDGLGKTETKPMFVSTVNNDFFNSQIGIATGNGTLFSDSGNLQKYSVNVKSGSADIIFGSDTVNLVAGDIINDFPTLGSLIVTSATTDFKMIWAVEVLT